MNEAPPEIVALYRYIANIGHPVAIDEIVENALPPQMRSDAYRAYTAARDEDGEDISEDYWTDRNKDRAWRWWIDQLLSAAITSKRLSIVNSDGTATRGLEKADQRFVPKTAPPVKYSDGKVRPWTIEHDREYQRAVAGQRVVQRADEATKRLTALDKKDQEYVATFIKDAVAAVKI